jgi:hypothetical protein
MWAVCLSHFSAVAAMTIGHRRTFGALMLVSMIASPTFMLVSGITLGYARHFDGAAYARFVDKLRARGIVLLTIVHLLMIPGFHFVMREPGGAYRTLAITDTIGVCLLLGPWIVERSDVRRRLAIAAALFAAAWAMASLPSDHWPTASRIVAGALFGSLANGWWLFNFPVVPWLAAYLLGTVIGVDVARAVLSGSRALTRCLLRWAARLAVTAGALGAVLGVAARRLSGHPALGAVARQLASPFVKLPPSPVYLLAYGAAGLAMMAVISVAIERRWLAWPTARLAEVGQSSLIVFVVQSFLYYVVELLWLPPRHAWPLMFLASLVVVHVTARAWLASGGNRLLAFRIPWASSTMSGGAGPWPVAPSVTQP